jgi:plasmid stabilization system protein ParE
MITTTAEIEIAEIEAWWTEHRSKNPMLFTNELEAAFALLREHPHASIGHDARTRRLLLRRSRYHVYFRIAGDTVMIDAVVGATTRPAR